MEKFFKSAHILNHKKISWYLWLFFFDDLKQEIRYDLVGTHFNVFYDFCILFIFYDVYEAIICIIIIIDIQVIFCNIVLL